MNNTLKDENLLSLLSLNNMIVPEIQREYVWGKKENETVLERFLKNIKDNCDACNECKQVHKQKDINIGFLYSYKPSYVTLTNERYLDEFLIDGQQRFTTLFLLLAYLAVKEDRVKDFLTIVRFDAEVEEINFDYKVRNLTHRFLIDFLNSFKEDFKQENIFPIEKQTWFLSDYYADATIQAMLGALKTISEIFNEECYYFDYILSAVRFWHFKTEATSQGEELYITMNSRGEKLADNEQQKAQILSLPPDKLLEWGKKWEEWQDFFWKHRGNNPNADKGFNEFIRWIQKIDSSKDQSPAVKTVEQYFKAVRFLFVESGIFEDDISWLAPQKGENEQIDLFVLLPAIKYVDRFGLETEKRKIVRVKQFFKNLSQITNVRKAVNNLLPAALKIIQDLPDDDIASMLRVDETSIQILTKEEKIKFELYLDFDYQREDLEDEFWKTERHPIWNGEIMPLIEWAKDENGDFRFDEFKKYNDKFNELFHGDSDALKSGPQGDLDITRRALLTQGLANYPIDGRNFCLDCTAWKTLINHNKNKLKIFFDKLIANTVSDERIEMINSYNDVRDKNYYIIKHEEFLKDCTKKRVCAGRGGGYQLLSQENYRKNSNSYHEFSRRLFIDIETVHLSTTWKIWFFLGDPSNHTGCGVADEKEEKNGIAIDYFFNGNNYTMEVFHRDHRDPSKISEAASLWTNKLSIPLPSLNKDKRYEATGDYETIKSYILALIDGTQNPVC